RGSSSSTSPSSPEHQVLVTTSDKAGHTRTSQASLPFPTSSTTSRGGPGSSSASSKNPFLAASRAENVLHGTRRER
ncbi:unnamed protein product, partial [Amoebophrya sp. A120]